MCVCVSVCLSVRTPRPAQISFDGADSFDGTDSYIPPSPPSQNFSTTVPKLFLYCCMFQNFCSICCLSKSLLPRSLTFSQTTATVPIHFYHSPQNYCHHSKTFLPPFHHPKTFTLWISPLQRDFPFAAGFPFCSGISHLQRDSPFAAGFHHFCSISPLQRHFHLMA